MARICSNNAEYERKIKKRAEKPRTQGKGNKAKDSKDRLTYKQISDNITNLARSISTEQT